MGDYDTYKTVQGYVTKYGQEYGVSPDLINAVINSETNFRRGQVSKVGAQGLMQITPDVAKEYGVTDPFDPEQNIRAGTQYLSDLLDRFDGDHKKAIQAYHMGPTAVAKGRKPGRLTRRYVDKTMRVFQDPNEPEATLTGKRNLRSWTRATAGVEE